MYYDGLDSMRHPLQRMIKAWRWRRASKLIAAIAKHAPIPLDKGIQQTLIVLNALNIQTVESCEGHLDRGLHAPFVMVSVHSVLRKERHVDALMQDARRKKVSQQFSKEQVAQSFEKAHRLLLFSRRTASHTNSPYSATISNPSLLYSPIALLLSAFTFKPT